MSALRIEHVNVTVSDPERTSRLLEALFDWKIRWRGSSQMGGHTIHVGSDQHYIALYNPDGPRQTASKFSKGRPLNHLGIEVDNLATIEARVISAGLQPFGHDDYEPGKRFYFFDEDGIEYEIVSYSADKLAEQAPP